MPLRFSRLPDRLAGFTLLEIALIVLMAGIVVQVVIFGQSLIRVAQIQALVAQQEAVTAAILAFQDRYRAPPGDHGNLQAAIVCEGVACPGGNDNGLVEAAPLNEDIIAWTQLSAAGFLSERFRIESPGILTPSQANTPRNVFGGFLHIATDTAWGPPDNAVRRLNAKTGNYVPVEIIAELDRRIDDGRPGLGRVQFSTYSAGYEEPPTSGEARCISGASADATWHIAGGQSNCGGASLLY